MDKEALEIARARTGLYRSALASLDPKLRALVGEIWVSGCAKKRDEKWMIGSSGSNVAVLSSKGASGEAAVIG